MFPNKVVNGVSSVTPIWFGLFDIAAVALGVVTAITWFGLELWWSDVGLRNPIVRK